MAQPYTFHNINTLAECDFSLSNIGIKNAAVLPEPKRGRPHVTVPKTIIKNKSFTI